MMASMASESKTPVLAIGDVHGHYDRFEALLKQEGIIDAEGNRINHDVFVVQLGDLGHFGYTGSHTGDKLCYKAAAKDRWVDIVLWGNHDRAVVNEYHAFSGYQFPPYYETCDYMTQLHDESRLLLAFEAHGFLLTHAGLHPQFKYNQDAPEEAKTDPAAFADFFNELDNEVAKHPVIDAISRKRGGPSPYGGILWRDADEKLYDDFRQIFGHSSKEKVREYHTKAGKSYCIDTGSRNNGRLAGIWLPDERIVKINMYKTLVTS